LDALVTDHSLSLRVQIEAPPQTVFRALTDPDDLADWFAESAEVDLDENKYEFWGRYAPQGERPRQLLQAVEPDRVLRYTWEFDGAEPTTVDLSIEAVPGEDGEEASIVTVRHEGLPIVSVGQAALDCFWHVSVANLASYSEGVETMPPFDFSVPAQGDALVRTVIGVPPDEVFAALLDPSQVDKWAGGSATIKPEVGGRYDFGLPEGPVRIEELEPDKVLAYSWHHADGPDTTVRWTFRSSRGSTYLTLVHSGFADDDLAEQLRQGWPSRLVELKRILELGDAWQPLKLDQG
jgi:uncharacterized protein YndB with AHSA1/START domain